MSSSSEDDEPVGNGNTSDDAGASASNAINGVKTGDAQKQGTTIVDETKSWEELVG